MYSKSMAQMALTAASGHKSQNHYNRYLLYCCRLSNCMVPYSTHIRQPAM